MTFVATKFPQSKPTLTPALEETTGWQSIWQKWARRPLLGQIWGQRALYPGRTQAENLDKMLKTSLKLRAGPCGMIGTICAMKDKRNSSPLIVHAAKPQAMQVRKKKGWGKMKEKREKKDVGSRATNKRERGGCITSFFLLMATPYECSFIE